MTQAIVVQSLVLEDDKEFIEAVIHSIIQMNLKASAEIPLDQKKFITWTTDHVETVGGDITKIRITIYAGDPMVFYNLGLTSAELISQLKQP